MSYSVRVGDVEVVAIQDKDHVWTRDWHYPDITPEQWEPYEDLISAPEGYTMISFSCYLIRSADHTVLIDAGWGPKMAPPGVPEGPGKLIDELAALGVGVDDVDIVALTHMHADHTGWMLNREGETKPTFGRARYLLPEDDWKHYTTIDEMHPNERQALDIGEFDVLDLIRDAHVLTPNVVAEATPGHSPGHTSFVVDSGGERIFIMGDLVHHPVVAHETEWVCRFDEYPEQAVAMRQKILNRLEAEGTLVGTSHFTFPSIGYFVRKNGRREWQPI